MGKIRIYELARELNMTNTELVDRLHEIEYPVKSHMSSVDESDLPDIKAKLSGSGSTKKKAAKLEESRNGDWQRIFPDMPLSMSSLSVSTP